MQFLKNLFNRKKKSIEDVEFGTLTSIYSNGNNITWQMNFKFLDSNLNLSVNGNENGISEKTRKAIHQITSNQNKIIQGADQILRDEYQNVEMEYSSLDELFELEGISLENDETLEFTFSQKDSPYYHFNVFFMNFQPTDVSIDS